MSKDKELSLDEYSYEELKQFCRDYGVPFKGNDSKDVLKEKIRGIEADIYNKLDGALDNVSKGKKLEHKDGTVTDLKGDPLSRKKEKIVMYKDDYSHMMEAIDVMRKKIQRLEFAGNKSRLFKYDEANKDEQRPIYGIRLWAGKVVLSWDNMVNNICEQNPKTGSFYENQKVRIYLEDGSSEELDYATFEKNWVRVDGELVEKRDKGRGEVIFILERTDNGEQVEINSRFIN